MTNFVVARNTISGVVGLVPESYLDHPVFKDHLVIEDEDAKDFVPELYKPKTAGEFTEAKAPAKSSASDDTSDGIAETKEK